MKRIIFTLSLLAIISFGAFIKASNLKTIICTKDNTMIQAISTTSQNSNALYSITAGRTNQDGTNAATISIRRAFVYFDIAANIPSGSTIDSVRLSLYFNKTSGVGTNVNLYKVLADWGEGTSYQTGGQGGIATQNDLTWFCTFYNATTPANSSVWSTPGGDFDPVVRASAYAGTGSGTGVEAYGIKTWASTTMTSDVQAWLTTPSTNFGWVLKGDESTGQTSKQYLSRETGTTTGTDPTAPALKVYYTTPGTTTGLNSELAASISTYPNPATDFVNVNFSKTSSEKVYIYNTCGALMKVVQANNEDKLTISLSGINKGVYLIQVGPQTSRLIVK